MSDAITSRDQVFVKELVGYFKAANAYELFDESGNKLGEVKEDIPGWFKKLLKFSDWKTMLSFKVDFFDGDEQVFLRIRRKFSFFRSKVFAEDADGRVLGSFKQKLLSLGGKFEMLDPEDRTIGEVKGDWKGWDFTVTDAHQQTLGQITKKWSGLGKELFTSADNYVISVNPDADVSEDMRKMIFAAGICIDMVLKERGR